MLFVTIYLFQFVVIIHRYQKIIHAEIKTILFLFLFFMLLQAIGHMIMMLDPKLFGERDDWNFDLHQTEIFIQLIVSVYMILFYKVMFMFKRVQAQISDEHSTMMEILNALTKLVKLEKTFIFFGILMTVSIEVIYIIGRNIDLTKPMEPIQTTAWYIYLVSSILIFLINLYMLNDFRHMASFFIIHLIEERSRKFVKVVIYLFLTLILISLIRSLTITQIVNTIAQTTKRNIWNEQKFLL